MAQVTETASVPVMTEDHICAIEDAVFACEGYPKTPLILFERLREILSNIQSQVGGSKVLIERSEVEELQRRLQQGAYWSLELWQQLESRVSRWLHPSPAGSKK